MFLGFPLYFSTDGRHLSDVGGTMLVLAQDYRGGDSGRRGSGGRGGGARCHARVRGQPLPGGMLEYVAKLCSTLVLDNDLPAKAWGPYVQLYLGCFLPPDAKPDEAKRACELLRARTE